MRAQINFLPDGGRLHLQDGPIDLITGAFGALAERKRAYEAAMVRFLTILDELCQELPLLRTRPGPDTRSPKGTTAGRMASAVAPYATRSFITPMAAVAGAVAEEILQAMISAAHLSKVYVNDGGDIAFYLAPGEHFSVGMIDHPARPSLFGTASVCSTDPIRGIATSGCQGRSFSLGIADAVTVLAERAAMADAAATIVANAVDLPNHPNVRRAPARSLSPDSDLVDLPVTCEVGDLSREEVNRALNAGVAVAEQLRSECLIHSAALHLRGVTRVVTQDDFIVAPAFNAASTRSFIHA
jgi:ApbE superfamily uncharacterized protein (UPF0280 family)